MILIPNPIFSTKPATREKINPIPTQTRTLCLRVQIPAPQLSQCWTLVPCNQLVLIRGACTSWLSTRAARLLWRTGCPSLHCAFTGATGTIVSLLQAGLHDAQITLELRAVVSLLLRRKRAERTFPTAADGDGAIPVPPQKSRRVVPLSTPSRFKIQISADFLPVFLVLTAQRGLEQQREAL